MGPAAGRRTRSSTPTWSLGPRGASTASTTLG
jgi:hypothetical protein